MAGSAAGSTDSSGTAGQLDSRQTMHVTAGETHWNENCEVK